jgi:hypothetical protein
MKIQRAWWLCLAIGLSIAACDGSDKDDDGGGSNSNGGSGDDSDSSDDGGIPTGNGVTPCGNFPDEMPKSCQAGQYCVDEILSDCSNGCLSDTNCTDDQLCVKESGEDVGSCQTEGTATTCEAVCEKLQACDPSVTDTQCNQFCSGVNDACRACVVEANCGDDEACLTECSM